MGLFVLASLGLSMYIWSMTLYNVYKPMASTLSAAAPSMHPLSIVSAVQAAFKKTEEVGERTPKRVGRRRKHLTLAEAQREELRESLKILFIWLACKGTEPVFDNTFGYVVPFYSMIKVFFLIIFARFRTQLSVHLFDSFVIPLGRPNTPLINSTAFTSLILPSLRFLLSLPLAHLTAAIQRALTSLLTTFGNEEEVRAAESSDPDRAQKRRQTLEAERVPPPRVKVSSRHASTSVLRRDGKDGPSGGQGGTGNSLRYQRSMGTLSSSRSLASSNRNVQSTSRHRSVSSRMTPNTQDAFDLLQSLPSVPHGLQGKSLDSQLSNANEPVVVPATKPVVAPTSSSPLTTFAYIPSQQSNITTIPSDIVPPPDGHVRSFLPSTSPMKMPGTLGSSPTKNVSTMDKADDGEADERIENPIFGKQYTSKDAETIAKKNGSTNKTENGHSSFILNVEKPAESSGKTSTATKRKVNEVEDVAEGKETKKHVSPKKPAGRSTTADATRNKKIEKEKESKESTSTLPRSRSKRSVKQSLELEAEEEPKKTTKIPRTVRSRSKN